MPKTIDVAAGLHLVVHDKLWLHDDTNIVEILEGSELFLMIDETLSG